MTDIEKRIKAFAIWRHASTAIVFGNELDQDVLAFIIESSCWDILAVIVEQDFDGDEREARAYINDWCEAQTTLAKEEGRINPRA